MTTIAIGATSFVAGNALAQNAILEEIVVTAQRREEAIQEVPISVTALSGERFTSLFESGADVLALANRVPNLYVESSNGRLAPRFYMRGLGNTDFDLAASQSVSVLFDEVVQENVILKSFPIFDIERLEVLRGPQGTLFGRNTTAGIVHFHTAKPSEEFDGYVLGTVGSLGTFNVEGAVGGPLNSDGTLMARLSVLSQTRDDWIDNSFTGEGEALGGWEERAWRLQILADDQENFSALLNLHGRDMNNGTASIFRANILDTNSNELNSNFDRDVVQFDEGDNNPQEAQGIGGSLKLDLTFGNDVTLTSITAYETVENFSLGDIDGGFGAVFLPVMGPGFIPFPAVTQDGLNDLDQFTQEFRLSKDMGDGVFWQAGFFYFDGDFTIETFPFFVPSTIQTHSNEAWALFGQVSVDLGDRWTVVGGVRYTDDQKELTVSKSPVPTADVEVSDDNISWDLSATFAMNDNINLYGRIANGFRAPTIQGRDIAFFGAPSTALSETNTSIEVGFKSLLADDRIRINGALFRYVIEDQQVSAIGGGGNFILLVNADEGVGFGLDLDAEFLITENLFVGVGVSFVDTEIDDPNLTVTPCGSGQCTPLNPLDPLGNAIVDGNPLPQAPDAMYNIFARWDIPTDDGGIYISTDWSWQGETHFFLYETAEYRTDGNFEGGVRAGYYNDTQNWELAVFGRNITDEENLIGGIDFNNNTGFVNEPRIWGITFTKRWGDN